MTEKNRQIRIVRTSEQEEAADLRKTTTPQERMETAYQLSLNAWAIKGKTIPESGLHRHIVRVGRMKDLKR